MYRKWEITAGKSDLVWYDRKQSKEYWWVCTWRKDAFTGYQSATDPFLVYAMEDIPTLVCHLPPHAFEFGNKQEKPKARFYAIDPKDVWARMPFNEKPKMPNVEMAFETNPWEEVNV